MSNVKTAPTITHYSWFKVRIDSTTVPYFSGGVQETSDLTAVRSLAWLCPHHHRFDDQAIACAGRAMRRFKRTQQWLPQSELLRIIE